MMRSRKSLAFTKWVSTLAAITLILLWLTSLFRGYSQRQGLFTIHIEDGAINFWHASSYFPNYARDNSHRIYPITLHSVDSYIPLLTSTPGRFDVIARLPFWLPLLILTPTAALLWRRRPTPGLCSHCRYDRQSLTPTAPCPECGTVPTNEHAADPRAPTAARPRRGPGM